jgi:hypothetical protein
MNINVIRSLSDEQLLRDVETAAARERGAATEVIALLAEMDARRLYLQQGYSSMFVYCTRGLHLSEHAAYGRIEAARAARKFPIILDRLAEGSITLTTICLLSNHLTADNHRQLLAAAMHKTRREVEEQVAGLRPEPAVPFAVRKLPEPRPLMASAGDQERHSDAGDALSICVGSEPAPVPVRSAEPPEIRPLAPERYKVQFTVDRAVHERLRKVQDLMRHVAPDGDLAVIFDRALTMLLRDLERRKLGHVNRDTQTAAPKTTSRYVPSRVRRAVWARDEGRCAFVGMQGRCDERGFLEFHHVIPFADGGKTTVENLQLRCRAHNDYEARRRFDFPMVRERVALTTCVRG